MPATLTNNAVESDILETLPLEQELKNMTKAALIKYAFDVMGYKVDPSLKKELIIRELVKIDENRKGQAKKANEASLKMSIDKDNPMIKVRFFNNESPGADIEFANSEPRGMRGPVNKNGFKKCPSYHLYHGEEYKLPYAIYEFLGALTFTTYKTQIDPASGQILGNIPIIKPRFILQPILTKEQIIQLNT